MLVFTPDMHGRFTWRCFAFAAIVFRFLRSSGRLSILNFCNNSEYPEMLRLFLTRVWFMWNMFQLVYVFLQTELCRMISKSCQQESRRPTMTLWQITGSIVPSNCVCVWKYSEFLHVLKFLGIRKTWYLMCSIFKGFQNILHSVKFWTRTTWCVQTCPRR